MSKPSTPHVMLSPWRSAVLRRYGHLAFVCIGDSADGAPGRVPPQRWTFDGAVDAFVDGPQELMGRVVVSVLPVISADGWEVAGCPDRCVTVGFDGSTWLSDPAAGTFEPVLVERRPVAGMDFVVEVVVEDACTCKITHTDDGAVIDPAGCIWSGHVDPSPDMFVDAFGKPLGLSRVAVLR